MRPYITYQLSYYLNVQKGLHSDLDKAKAAYAADASLHNREHLEDVRRLLATISVRVVSARRNMNKKQILIDSGILGEMPTTFSNGMETKYCPKCKERHDVVDFLAIRGNNWIWLDTCQKCLFEERSQQTINAVDSVHEKTITFNQQNVSTKQCACCGITYPIENFRILGRNKYKDTPYRRDYLCYECRKAVSIDPSNSGQRKEMPLLFNPQKPAQRIFNPKFFYSKRDMFDPEFMDNLNEALNTANKEEADIAELISKICEVLEVDITDIEFKNTIYTILKTYKESDNNEDRE